MNAYHGDIRFRGSKIGCGSQNRIRREDSGMSNGSPHAVFDLEYIVNYVTPGYATAVYVSASGVERIQTTAESHRRIAIIEVVWTPVLTRRSSRVWQKANATHPQRRRPRQRGISYKLLGTREWFIIHRTDCGHGVVHE